MKTCTQCATPLANDLPQSLCARCMANVTMTTETLAPADPLATQVDIADDAADGIKRLGPIHLIQRIGKGGMGEVWLGRHELLGRNVAVKLLLNAIHNEKDPAFTTFIAGARVAASFEHVGLNKVYDADVENGVPYLVLELLEGPNLADLVQRSGPLNLPTARAVLESVSEAVAELNQRDLVHRDLKPSNIVLTTDGRVVVTDFGIACARPTAGSGGGARAGTPAYMAPEMFDGTVSARTDVYALGMTAYHLFVGRTAFTGDVDEQCRQHRDTALDIEPLRAAGVPQEVIDVIVRATSKDILFRPKSAWQVLVALRAAFNAAGVKRSTRDELVRTLKDRTLQPAATTQPVSKTPSSKRMVDAVAELAARKRGLRPVNNAEIPPPAPPPPPPWPTDPAYPARLRADGRRARNAGIVASVVPAVVAALGVFGLSPVPHVLALARLLHIPFPLFQLVAGLAVALIIIMSCLGSLLLYRVLRGIRLPIALARTTCGWCKHELRWLTQPICTECGHRIGDRGPDQQGRRPPGLRRSRKLAVVMAALFCFLGTYFWTVLIVALFVFLRVSKTHATTIGSAGLPLHFVPLLLGNIAALFVYEACAQRNLRVSGRSWCRACAGELQNLTAPACPACKERI